MENNNNDEVAILLLTHNNFIETIYFINNLMLNTDVKYRLHIFDYESADKVFVEDLKKVCKEYGWYFKSVSKEMSLCDIYNQMLETVYQKYAVFMPINAIVNRNWLRDLKYYYTSIKNSGCISIKSNESKLTLTSLLVERLDEPEDEMRVVWVNSSSMINDFIFFEMSRLEKVGKFDSRFDCKGLQLAEFSFRFLGHGWLNYYITKNSCTRLRIEDEVLFPKITKEAKAQLKSHIETMVKNKQYEK